MKICAQALTQSWTDAWRRPLQESCTRDGHQEKVAKGDYDATGRKAVRGMDPEGLSYEPSKISMRINKQSPDIAKRASGRRVRDGHWSRWPEVRFGYTTDEIEEAMPSTRSTATRLWRPPRVRMPCH